MLDWNKLEHISNEIDNHLKKNREFSNNLLDVRIAIDKAREAKEDQLLWEMRLLRDELKDIKDQLRKYGLPEANQYEKRFSFMKNCFISDKWPEAVDPEAICYSDTEKSMARATSILHMVVGENVKNKKFLDIGCGEGHVVMKARELGAEAFGYDVHAEQFKFQNTWMTNKFEEVYNNAPYDIILLHDVLDHIEQLDPVSALRRMKEILGNEGRIYVRNHPWSSRHGGHLYKQINKAFAHLIFDDIELARIGGHQCEYNIKVIRPLETYRHWFKEAGFNVKSEIPIRSPVEKFFLDQSYVKDILLKIWGNEVEMIQNMEIDFVEYILEVSKDLNHQII